MHSEPITFYSDQYRLAGQYFLPDAFDTERPQPLIIPCSGFTGLCSIHPARFARYLTARGYFCFGFDYRGFGDSQGVPGRVLLEEQVRDILHATAFASTDPRVDPRRLVLLGWGMGAGLVLDAARHLPGVVGIIALNGFYDGWRFEFAHRGQQGMQQFVERVSDERCERVRTGNAKHTDPFEIYPLDPQSRTYVDQQLRRYEAYDTENYSWELADSLLRWRPEAYASSMELPLLIGHGDQNQLHPVAEAEALYAAYSGPKQLYWIEGGGHTEWMLDDDPKFQALGRRLVEWLETHLPQE